MRLVSVSDWLRNGTEITTTSLRSAAGPFARPSKLPAGTSSRSRAAVSSARPASRDPIAIGVPARPSRAATPKPSAPDPPITVTDSAIGAGP